MMSLNEEERVERFSEYVKEMWEFVHDFTFLLQTGESTYEYVTTLESLPDLLKDIIMSIVLKTLEDHALLQLASKYLDSSDRIDRFVEAVGTSYLQEFTDEHFVEWSIMLCVISSFLYRHGFVESREITEVAMNIYCKDNNRYEIFRNLGCNL